MSPKGLDRQLRKEAPVDKLLWGTLHIKIIRCKNLRDLDATFGISSRDKSDPYVTAWVGDRRLYKTRTINNDLNPIFDEECYVPVGQETNGVLFLVQDQDDVSKDDTLGMYFLPVTELIAEVTEINDGLKPGDQKRVGIHKEVYLDGKKKHGSLEFFIEFLPTRMVGNTMAVPGIYFDESKGNDVKLYMNADDDGSAPKVRYGGANDDEQVYEAPRLWRDIYDAICDAKHFVYVVGWSVDVDQYLLRGEELTAALEHDKYSPRIGDLLKAKAEDGVVVNMMVWDDRTNGQMGTHDEKARSFFKDTKVTAKFVSLAGDEKNSMMQGATKNVVFTHHQKFVIVDVPKKDGSGERELMGFIGGIDLAEGRWDNRQHSLFRTLQSQHKGDAYSNCFALQNVAGAGPREPWHDIHSSVRGPGVLQLIQNFNERWMKQCPKDIPELINPESLGFNKQTLANEGGWHTQVSRSIDARVCFFDKSSLQKFKIQSIDEMAAAQWKNYGKDKTIPLSKRFETTFNADLQYNRTLHEKKGRIVDCSIELSNIHHIRRAKHFIYIESQYFMGSSHMWLNKGDRKVKCGNLIASEVTLKICDKIADGERFAAYILIPMWMEGVTETAPIQEMIYWQKSTIEAMYLQIQDAIDLRCRTTSDHGLKVTDYLNFYCLGNRETTDRSEAVDAPTTPSGKLLHKTRRHQIYIHSKFMVVDDEVSLIGTANINQRSMDGCRDSEIMMTSWRPDQLATDDSVATGDVHGYRLHIWASITNEMNDVFRDPSSVECVRKVNAIAQDNWEKYLGDTVVEMDSHLLPYTMEYFEKDREVRARKELKDGKFPDTKASVLGGKSMMLPDYVTT